MRHVLVAAILLATFSGRALADSPATFNFSYTFGDGQQVTGSFTGVSTDGGQSVSQISNVSVSLNGIPFAPVTVNGTTLGSTPLQINAWNTALETYDDTTPVTIYANGALNNFVISDVDEAVNSSPDYYFTYVNDPVTGSAVVAVNFLQTDSFSTASGNPTQLAIDSPAVASSWQLTEGAAATAGTSGDAPMPLWAIGALGAGLVAVARRRLRAPRTSDAT
jgi:hypothetical protein